MSADYCAIASFDRSKANFLQSVQAGTHQFSSDAEPASGGANAGPSPHSLLCAALAACTSMTVEMYAKRKNLPLDDCIVEVHARREGDVEKITRKLEFKGQLTAEQLERLRYIADACPIHKALTGKITVETLA